MLHNPNQPSGRGAVANFHIKRDTTIAPTLVTPTYTLGRLAGTRSPRGEVSFSYDAYGLVNARTFRGEPNGPFVEKQEHNVDGSLARLEFNLPDLNHAAEIVRYGYDSAGRLRSATFVDASGEQNLYQAEVVDPWGRVREAHHGGSIVYHADYADFGRRLMKGATLETPHGSRRLIFLNVDPLGRELSRREVKDGAATGPTTDVSYDALGRLALAIRTEGPTTLASWKFEYDPLGNVVSLEDMLGAADAALKYGGLDRDRVCRIDFGNGGATGGPCNVLHDRVGNIVNEPTRNGERQFSYFWSGTVRSISSQGAQANFFYDAFGRVEELDVQGTAIENRRDRRYGGFIEERDIEGSAAVPQIIRRIPGLGGTLGTRRGSTSNWIFEFGELRGNRFFVNRDGKFIQEVDYLPFGEGASTGAPAGTADYTNYQWNGGDAIAAFRLSHLGARIYDPAIGRFVSRDPLLVARAATTTNPYAFAMNDPLNGRDPTGLDVNEGEHKPLVPLLPFGCRGGQSGLSFEQSRLSPAGFGGALKCAVAAGCDNDRFEGGSNCDRFARG